MKMHNKVRLIKNWGKQIDPGVTAKTYLESKDVDVAKWAKENEGVLQELDRETINLYRRHSENADFRSADELRVEKIKVESGQDPANLRGNLPTKPDKVWIDRMLSKKAEDFTKVMENEELAKAMEELTPRQIEVLFHTYSKEKTPQEISAILGTTDRNVRDILKQAKDKLKEIMTYKSGEGTIDAVAMVLFWRALPTFAISWTVTKRMYPKLKKLATGKAA